MCGSLEISPKAAKIFSVHVVLWNIKLRQTLCTAHSLGPFFMKETKSVEFSYSTNQNRCGRISFLLLSMSHDVLVQGGKGPLAL